MLSFKFRIKVGVDSIEDVENNEDDRGDGQHNSSKLLNFCLLGAPHFILHHQPDGFDLGVGGCGLVVDLLQTGENEAQERQSQAVEEPYVDELDVCGLQREILCLCLKSYNKPEAGRLTWPGTECTSQAWRSGGP